MSRNEYGPKPEVLEFAIMSPAAKSKVFIGSSREALPIARALQHELRDVAQSELWSQGMFRLGAVALDDLARAVNGFDFGVFVFAPDDVVKMRDATHAAVRDNVLFELGMFIGKLGSQRSFFVLPEAGDQLHVPSDLTGITAAKYDSKNANLQVGVSAAVFEISRAISTLGPLQGGRNVLFASDKHGHPRVFQGKEAHVYKGKDKVGDKAKGSLAVGPDGLLTIGRSNNAGRFEIHIRPHGPGKPSFTKNADPPAPRCLRVSCSVKAEGATHKLRFVAKDEDQDKWIASETRVIEVGDWNRMEFYLWVDATRDFLLRIDDEEVSEAPATLLIRDLTVSEESS
jgi:hypothetical protein